VTRYILLDAETFTSDRLKSLSPQSETLMTFMPQARPETFAFLSGQGSQRASMAVMPLGGEDEAKLRSQLNLVDEVTPSGPKIVTFEAETARQFRQDNPDFRLVPERVYHRAVMAQPATSSKALRATLEAAPTLTRMRFKVADAHTGAPLSGATLVLVLDAENRAGRKRTTETRGMISERLPQNGVLKELQVYPPPGYQGQVFRDLSVSEQFEILLTPLDRSVPSLLQTFYGAPKADSGKGVKVAVIDSGIDALHPELSGKVLGQQVYALDEIPIDQDIRYDGGHGTHVAGLIAGRSCGVAPGAELYDYRVFSPYQGGAHSSDIAKAIYHAVNESKVDLINLSLVQKHDDLAIEQAIAHAFEQGVLCIAAAGNSERNPVQFPARFKRTIAVSAFGRRSKSLSALEQIYEHAPYSERDDALFIAQFSDVGAHLDFTAPGVGLISSWPEGQYHRDSGTSMACPVVTGVAARMLSQDPKLSGLAGRRRALTLQSRLNLAASSMGFSLLYEGGGAHV
jgi:subtilisin